MARQKISIILTVFIDVLGIGIVVPVLPQFVSIFDTTPFVIFLLFSLFSLCAFLSAPYLGALSDRIGRRPVLLLSILSTTIGWYTFAFAHSIWFLFLGRIIDGLAAGNFPIAQSYLSDLSKSEKERTANLGLIGATFGAGFIIGPALGAFLSDFGVRVPFYAVAVLSTLNLLLAFFFVKESHHKEHRTAHRIAHPFQPIATALKDVALRSRYALWFLFNFAASMQQATFAVFLVDVYGFESRAIGYTIALVGGLIAINQGLLLKTFWLKKFAESTLEVWMLFVFALGFFMLGLPWLIVMILGFVPLVVGQSVARAIMTSRVVGIAGEKQKGQSLGVLASVQSIAISVGPIVAGIVYLKSPFSPFWIGSLVLFLAFAVAFYLFRNEHRKQDEEMIVVDTL